MSKYILLEDLLSDHFYPTFNMWMRHMVDFAPRASTKTSKNAIKIALKMLQNPNLEVVIVRQNYVDHRKSTFRELITAFKRLGVNLKQGIHYPKGTTGSLWIRTPKGGYVHFGHMHDVESFKGIVPTHDDNFIGIAWFFEITQFKGQEFDLNQAISSLSRGEKPFYYNIYELNPAPNKSDWTYEFVDKMRVREDAIVIEGTYLEVPEAKRKKWFGELIHEINVLKQIDPELYKHIYLGLPARLDGAVFKAFSFKRHVTNIKVKPNDGVRYIIGVDYGNKDGTSFILMVVNRGFKGIRVVKEYYHRNGYSPGEKEINAYSKDLLQFISECYDLVRSPLTVYIDEAATDFYNVAKQLIMQYTPGKCVIHKTKKNKSNEIIHRISVGNLMFGSDFIRIDKSCVNLLKAIDLAEYNKEGKIVDNTVTHFNDALDAWFYTWLHMIDNLRRIILKGTKYKE